MITDKIRLVRALGLNRLRCIPLLFILVAALAPTGYSQTSTNTINYSDCFIVGEVSEYKVSWMGLPLGWSKTFTEKVTYEGRDLIKIRMVSQNYKAYKHVYKVDDVTEVIVDPVTALPLRHDFILNEGSRHKSQLTIFDHKNRQAVFIDRLENTTNTVEIAENSRDVVTFLYASRKSNLEQLAADTQKIYVEGKVNDMGLKIGKRKKIRVTEVGKVQSTRLEPIAKFDGLFLREGRIFFWISDTDHRMITLTEASVPVGKVKVRLQKVSGTSDVFWNAED